MDLIDLFGYLVITLVYLVVSYFYFKKKQNIANVEFISENEYLKKRNDDLKEENNYLKQFQNEIKEKNNVLVTENEDLKIFKAKVNEKLNSINEKNEELKNSREKFKLDFENLSNRIFDEKIAKNKQDINSIISPFKQEIFNFKKRIEEVYHNDSSDRAVIKNEIKRLAELNERISEDAVNLTKALKGNNKIQGDWGELLLERILEESGLVENEMYDIQKSLRGVDDKKYRPDVIIHLPGKKDIIIDAKVSLKAYEDFYNAETTEIEEKALTNHMISLKNHIEELSSKNYEYLEGVNTLDYILMFIPIEGAYITALQKNRELFQFALKKNIMLVGPSTLLVTLRTIENFWKFKKQTDNVKKIAKRGTLLFEKFSTFVATLDKIGKNIDRAQVSYNDAKKLLSEGKGNLKWQADKLIELGIATQKELD